MSVFRELLVIALASVGLVLLLGLSHFGMSLHGRFEEIVVGFLFVLASDTTWLRSELIDQRRRT